MPNQQAGQNPNQQVTLAVQQGAAPPGWTNTQSTNGQPYCYQYTGGNGNGGNGAVDFKTGKGPAQVNLRLQADQRYTIASVSFQGDTAGQLSENGGPTQRVIQDQCTADINASYKVDVADSQVPGATIPCDPPIVNRPT